MDYKLGNIIIIVFCIMIYLSSKEGGGYKTIMTTFIYGIALAIKVYDVIVEVGERRQIYPRLDRIEQRISQLETAFRQNNLRHSFYDE